MRNWNASKKYTQASHIHRSVFFTWQGQLTAPVPSRIYFFWKKLDGRQLKAQKFDDPRAQHVNRGET